MPTSFLPKGEIAQLTFLVQSLARDSQIPNNLAHKYFGNFDKYISLYEHIYVDYLVHKYFAILSNIFHYMNKYMLQHGEIAQLPFLVQSLARNSQTQVYLAQFCFAILKNIFYFMNKYMLQHGEIAQLTFLVQSLARDSQIQVYLAHKYFAILTNIFQYMNKHMLQHGQQICFPFSCPITGQARPDLRSFGTF